jgi:hypothetical protein
MQGKDRRAGKFFILFQAFEQINILFQLYPVPKIEIGIVAHVFDPVPDQADPDSLPDKGEGKGKCSVHMIGYWLKDQTHNCSISITKAIHSA